VQIFSLREQEKMRHGDPGELLREANNTFTGLDSRLRGNDGLVVLLKQKKRQVALSFCKYLDEIPIIYRKWSTTSQAEKKEKIKKKKCGFIKIPSLFSFLSYFLFAKPDLLQGHRVSSLACS